MHPILLHAGHLYLPTFGVLAMIGLLAALALSSRTAALTGLDPNTLWDSGIFLVTAAYIFSRLLLVATQFKSFVAVPLLLVAEPSLTPSGILLTLVATWLWFRARHLPVVCALDAWAPCATLLWSFLALGHFTEGSDPGLRSAADQQYPVALYAALVAALLTTVLYLSLHRSHRTGETAALGLAGSGLAQFLLSFFREPGVAAWFGLDQLQWLALVLITTGGMLLAFAPLKQPNAIAQEV